MKVLKSLSTSDNSLAPSWNSIDVASSDRWTNLAQPDW